MNPTLISNIYIFTIVISLFLSGCDKDTSELRINLTAPAYNLLWQDSIASGDTILFSFNVISGSPITLVDVSLERYETTTTNQEATKIHLWETFTPDHKNPSYDILWIVPSDITPTPDKFVEYIVINVIAKNASGRNSSLYGKIY